MKVSANLMINKFFINKIVGYADLRKTDSVLEIGAGTGNLTEKLLSFGCVVYAVEKNRRFCRMLEEKFGGKENFNLVCGDALEVVFPECNKIVSNLPYEISRKITEKILKQNYELAVLVYQKEFAEKLVAKPGNRNYRFISALTQSYAKVEVLDTIPPNAFKPMPKVSSAIVRLINLQPVEEKYAAFLRTLFSHRNKKISKVLKLEGLGGVGEKKCCQLSAEELKQLYSIYLNQIKNTHI